MKNISNIWHLLSHAPMTESLYHDYMQKSRTFCYFADATAFTFLALMRQRIVYAAKPQCELTSGKRSRMDLGGSSLKMTHGNNLNKSKVLFVTKQ